MFLVFLSNARVNFTMDVASVLSVVGCSGELWRNGWTDQGGFWNRGSFSQDNFVRVGSGFSKIMVFFTKLYKYPSFLT